MSTAWDTNCGYNVGTSGGRWSVTPGGDWFSDRTTLTTCTHVYMPRERFVLHLETAKQAGILEAQASGGTGTTGTVTPTNPAPSQMPELDYVVAGSVFTFFLSTVLLLYLISMYGQTVLNAVRKL